MGIPNMGAPKGNNLQDNKTMSIDEINFIINNENEHPHIREQMKKARDTLFPDYIPDLEENKEEVSIDTKPKARKINEVNKLVTEPNKRTRQKKEVNLSNLSLQTIDSNSFDNIIRNRMESIPEKEVLLLSDSTSISIRGMTVREYKALVKQYGSFLDDLRNNPDEVNVSEFCLFDTLDCIINNCVLSKDFDVYSLMLYDWIYILLNIRLISKGIKTEFGLSCKNPDCDARGNIIKNFVDDIIKKLYKSKDKFVKESLGEIKYGEHSLLINTLTRGDLKAIQGNKLKNDDAEDALSIKIMVQGDNAIVLTPEQRMTIFETLEYGDLLKLEKLNKENRLEIFKCFGEFKCKFCKEVQYASLADFILFFYDI